MNDSTIIPYGQHYRCFPQMIGSTVNQSVFMYLMDEYTQRLKGNEELSFTIKANEIASDRNISWRSVINSLQSLQDMKLIAINDNHCTVDGDRFVSLIHAFNNIKGRKQRKEFAQLLEAGDYESLSEYGYIFKEFVKNDLLNLRGGIEQCGPYDKCHNPMTNIIGYDKKQRVVEGEPYDKCHNPMINVITQPYDKCHNPMTNVITSAKKHRVIEDETSAKKQNPMTNIITSDKKHRVMLKSRSFFNEMSNSIKENYEKAEFKEKIGSCLLDIFKENELDVMIDAIFDETEGEDVDFGPEWFCLLAKGMIMLLGVGKEEKEEKETKKETEEKERSKEKEEKEINKEKEKKEEIAAVLSRKNQSLSFIGDSPLANPDLGLNFQENEEEEFVDLTFCQEIASSYTKSSLNSTLSYQDLKRKSRLPFIPVDEVKNIISDLSLCLDRPDKIFINQVWDHLLPFYVFDYEDENGNIVEKQQSPDGMPFYTDRIIRDIIMPAFERTQEIISQGKIKIQGVELPVTNQTLNPEDVERIIDFKLSTKDGDPVYIISMKNFRNIYAQEIPVIPRKNIREDREADKRYMQEIILIGDDDDRYTELTPIELVIYNFLSEYFNINDDGSIDEPKQMFVNRVQLGRFYLSVIEKGLTEKDFLSVLFRNEPDKRDGSLQLKSRMFDSNKIKEWNAFRSLRSVINLQDIKLPMRDRKCSRSKINGILGCITSQYGKTKTFLPNFDIKQECFYLAKKSFKISLIFPRFSKQSDWVKK